MTLDGRLPHPAPLVARAIKRGEAFRRGSNDTLITRQRGRQIKFRVRKLALARARVYLSLLNCLIDHGRIKAAFADKVK